MKIIRTIRKPDDRHAHLRDSGDGRLQRVRRFAWDQFYTVAAMPNIEPPVTRAVHAASYERRILEKHGRAFHPPHFRLQIVMFLTNRTKPSDVVDAFNAGYKLWKYYPNYGTTASPSGLLTPRDIQPGVLEMMQSIGATLCIHGEVTIGAQDDAQLREYEFIPHLAWLVDTYPTLRVSVEHVSDRRMMEAIYDMPSNVVATVTAHHPFIFSEHAAQDPHCCCMPAAKSREDMEFLADQICHAHEQPKLIYGSDSAPHYLATKVNVPTPASGVFTHPVAIPLLFDHFRRRSPLPLAAWDAFMIDNGTAFYDDAVDDEVRGTLTLLDEPWIVPLVHGDIVPFMAGEVLPVRVEEMSWFGEAA